MKHLVAPKGWAQPLLRPATEPWAGLRAAIAAGPQGTLQRLEAAARHQPSARVATEGWRAASLADATERFVVGHGYESDPAVFATRMLLEANAQGVVEGLAIAAVAIGATQAILAVRADEGAAIRAVEAVVAAGIRDGALGLDAAGSGREISVAIRPLQGSNMIGEPTVLLKALDGKRGQPEQMPPYPSSVGYRGKPTVVSRVATLAAATWIMAHDSAAYADIGDPGQPGTLLVQIGGCVAQPGIIEVPTGTTLADIVAAAGGPSRGATIKALLVGGPSGGFVPAQLLAATPYSDAGLETVGGHVGSGAVLALDASAEIPELAAMLARWSADEACGKTIPCRIGTRRLAEIGQRFVDGLAGPADAARLRALAADVADSALCAHERLAPTPLLTGVRYFEREFYSVAAAPVAATTAKGRN